MKRESDSESAEEIDMKATIIELRQTVKILETRLKNKDVDWKYKIAETTSNMDRLQSNYQFSINANASLKADYDLLQEKFDKHMKTSNNVIQDRKEDIDRLNQRVATLQGFYDEQEEIQAKAKEANEKAIADVKAEKDEEIANLKKKADASKSELDEAKIDFGAKIKKLTLRIQELEGDGDDKTEKNDDSDKSDVEN